MHYLAPLGRTCRIALHLRFQVEVTYLTALRSSPTIATASPSALGSAAGHGEDECASSNLTDVHSEILVGTSFLG